MHLRLLSIFLYYLTSFQLVSSRRLKRDLEDSALGKASHRPSFSVHFSLIWKALLDPSAGTGSDNLAPSTPNADSKPEQIPGTSQLQDQFTVAKNPQPKNWEDYCRKRGLSVACCNGENRCVWKSTGNHQFCYHGVTCCKDIDLATARPSVNDPRIGIGVECDNQKKPAAWPGFDINTDWDWNLDPAPGLGGLGIDWDFLLN